VSAGVEGVAVCAEAGRLHPITGSAMPIVTEKSHDPARLRGFNA
jgi:hypothetical protein